MLRLVGGLLFLTLFSAGNAQVTPRPGGELHIVNPSTAQGVPTNDAEIHTLGQLTPLNRPTEVPPSSLPTQQTVSSALGPPVDVIMLDLRKLRKTARNSRTIGGDDEPSSFLSLRIAGKTYVMYHLQTSQDQEYGLHHVTTKIVNGAQDAYARFAIEDRTGKIIGTLKDGATRFRIASSSLSGTQLVYQLQPDAQERRHV